LIDRSDEAVTLLIYYTQSQNVNISVCKQTKHKQIRLRME